MIRTFASLTSAVLLALLAIGCSGAESIATGPSAAPALGAGATNAATNAPGGIPVPVAQSDGVGCPSTAPSYRVEIDRGHIDIKWGHNAAAHQVYVMLLRRNNVGPEQPIIIRELEAGQPGHDHYLERYIADGSYDGEISYEFEPSRNCGGVNGTGRSNAARFNVGDWSHEPTPVPEG
jgi:hypothetical protein